MKSVPLKTIFLCVVVGVVILLLLYFYFAPIYIKGTSIINPRNLGLSDARNYYSVLSSFITLLGLFLGFLYYRHKTGIDKISAESERRRKRLDYLINELKNYDNLVDDLIHKRFSSASDLLKIRNRISRSYETIIAMLKHKISLLGFDEEEAMMILNVHSFVEKNEILMQRDFASLKYEELQSVKGDYIDLIQDARQVCFQKIC